MTMNEYRIRSTGEVITEAQLRLLRDNVSLPTVDANGVPLEWLDAASCDLAGADPVLQKAAPAVTGFQVAERSGAVQDGLGNWVYAWTVREWTADEIAASKAAAVALIDAEADAVRAAVLGTRTTEYQDALADAQSFQSAGFTGTVPPYVQNWLDAKNAAGANWTAQEAAQDILDTGAFWKQKEKDIRAARLMRKELVRVAPSQADIDTQIAAWRVSRDQIRTDLGLPPV